MAKHKVFISYHHANDQAYKEALIQLNDIYDIFINGSVDTGEVDDSLTDERIRQIIRDDFLANSSVTIVLVGTGTWGRKHVDWEIYSSMYDGRINKRSGILVINLPSTGCDLGTAAHGDAEKKAVYPDVPSGWTTLNSKEAYRERYPYMPERLIDNLAKNNVKISVVTWERATEDPERLRFLIDAAYQGRTSCDYDLSRAMRRSDA